MAVAERGRIAERVDRLRETLEEPLLVTAGVNVQYLIGFKSSNAALLVDDERVLLFTDFRYATAASALKGVEFIQSQRSLLKTVGENLSGLVGFESAAMTYDGYKRLRDAGVDLVPRTGLVERLRATKDDRELAAIREAARITDATYAALAEEKFVGRTERAVAWTMEQLFHENGAHAVAFEVIVGAGATGSMPHGRPGDRVIEPNTTVVVDAGCVVDGYNSDCTRTFATGDLPDDLANAYDVCLRAELAGLDAIRVGVSGEDADAAARDVIEDAGLGENFGHGLGHGVGLLVHETPALRPESTDVLEARNVVTCEPGIYLAGRAGVRIEDLVVVTDGEPEILSTFPKHLVTVG
jgi:Xaa-Pro aminopeptidase